MGRGKGTNLLSTTTCYDLRDEILIDMAPMNVFVFDIETIPDLESGKKIFGFENLADNEIAEAMMAQKRAQTGNDFIAHHLQKIVAISIVWHCHDKVKVWSLGENNSDEQDILTRFFNGIEKYSPVLVSWNGTNFDLPVIHYRALLHGISAPRYWEIGNGDSNFKYNNYLNRYHYRHMDLLDILSGYSPRAYASLDQIAKMLNLPGKITISGSEVFDYYKAGRIEDIRNYCELDVLNTYLVYLRFELMRGVLTDADHVKAQEILKSTLQQEAKPHFQEFLTAWESY